MADRCRVDANGVAPDCPQLHKCGSCVLWSPREPSPTRRNLGVCLLENDARRTLDCNAWACPYYRPRRGSPAAAEHHARRRIPAPRTSSSRALGREAPAPTPAALSIRALEGAHDGGAIAELALECVLGGRRVPPLLERFRGGSVTVTPAGGGTPWTVPVERWFAWVCGVKAALEALEAEVGGCGLAADEKEKIRSDIKSMRGTLTTFNVLFRDREDHFVGQKGG